MPYGEGHFDKVYAIEATCHAQSLLKIYSEVFRVLKPGGLFALYEWIMTDAYNPSDPYHKKLKADILVSRVHSRVILCLRRTCCAMHVSKEHLRRSASSSSCCCCWIYGSVDVDDLPLVL